MQMHPEHLEAEIAQLHEDVILSLRDEMKRAKAAGEPVSASYLEVARKILKDNGIGASVKKDTPMWHLAKDLPYGSVDDEVE